jgi:transposase
MPWRNAGVCSASQSTTHASDRPGTAFPTPGHLAAHAGLAPVTRRSGTSIKGETRSQRGNRG